MIKKLLVMALFIGASESSGTRDIWQVKEDVLGMVPVSFGTGTREQETVKVTAMNEQNETPSPFIECIETTRTCCGNIDELDAGCAGVIACLLLFCH